jgi:uncharacterized protein YidB (DUF937 family)
VAGSGASSLFQRCWFQLDRPNTGNPPLRATNPLGGDVVNELSRRTGLSRDQVVDELARMLPNVVDKLTPDGRLPTRQEIMRLIS